MGVINEVLLAAGALLFVAILLSALSQRFGVPALLVFLAVGLFATELPGAPEGFIGTQTAALIGNLALAVILLDGGLRTRGSTFRMVAAPALVLATFGVVLTAVLVGLLAAALLGFDWRYAMLMGAIVGSTDAAAVFALLRAGGLRLNERVSATLEVESGINDPMAVFLTVSMIELIRLPDASVAQLVPMFALQLGVGLGCGWLLGRVLAEIIARVRVTEGLYALLIQSGGLLIFATTNLLGGSGFLAIFLAGMIVARRRVHVTEDVLRVSDGLAWLAQVVVPASSPILSAEAIEGSRDGRELVQLRVLPEARVAGRPLDELDLPGGARVVEIVRGGHSIAGTTLAAGDVVAVLARDETVGELEELFAPAPAIPEWSLDAATTLGDLRDYYGLEIPSNATAAQSVGEFLRAKLRGRPAIADRGPAASC